LRANLQLHPGRPGAAAQVEPGESRGRRPRADLAGQGREVREGHGLVQCLSRRGDQAHQGVVQEGLIAQSCVLRRRAARAARRRGGEGAVDVATLGPPTVLALNNVEVIYDGVILVLKGVSLTVREGGITTLLGANGAGKTTTLKAISGVLRSERGEVT